MDGHEDETRELRDGRRVVVRRAGEADAVEIPVLLSAAGNPRGAAFARAHERDEGAFALVARTFDDGELVAYAAWIAASAAGEGHADFFCAVEPALHGLGLGTLLVRAAADAAHERGLRALRVALTAQERALAAVLRDCGLRSRWDLDTPVARVDVLLGEPRPGWATP